MLVVTNLQNGASVTAPDWARTKRDALVYAASVVAVGRGNLTIAFEAEEAVFTDARGVSCRFAVERV